MDDAKIEEYLEKQGTYFFIHFSNTFHFEINSRFIRTFFYFFIIIRIIFIVSSELSIIKLAEEFYVIFLLGIRSMQDHGPKKPIAPLKRKKSAPRKKQFKKPRDNEHLADVLEIYEDNTLTQKGQFAQNKTN